MKLYGHQNQNFIYILIIIKYYNFDLFNHLKCNFLSNRAVQIEFTDKTTFKSYFADTLFLLPLK